MSENTLISCNGIAKKFCRDLKKSLWYGVKDACSEIIFAKSSKVLRRDEFWALNDITFELQRGECLGLLGRNGAGKTTLLKVLSGLIKPDKGNVSMYGKVGGLIALGAGFNGILTGRENIRINGAILGFSRAEIEAKIDEIIDFSELHDFIDAPVQTYSSGMSVRLGFSIAAILTKPDILLLDEVLAVGDIGFTIKCINTVRKIMENCAVIFVSHNLQLISDFCTKVLVMDSGRQLSQPASVQNGVDLYLSRFPFESSATGTQEAIIKDVRIVVDDKVCAKDEEPSVARGQFLSVMFSVLCTEKALGEINFFYELTQIGGGSIISFKNEFRRCITELGDDCFNTFRAEFGRVDLNTGKYCLIIGLVAMNPYRVVNRIEGVGKFRVSAKSVSWGKLVRTAFTSVSSVESQEE